MKRVASRGFTLVELMIVIAIIGVLAAIAIPSFLRYIKHSKTAEAEAIMRKMAEGAKSYFAAEQRYSSPIGSEPWHPGGVGSSEAGLPVPWSNYVFPGGNLAPLNTAEAECTGGASNIVGAPTRGSKVIPCLGIRPPPTAPVAATINKLRVDLSDPLYFKYFFESEGQGLTAIATISALADFVVGGPGHTVRQRVSVGASQEVQVGPASLTYELE